MTLIKSCPTHNTVYYKTCRECLHDLAKAEKAEQKASKKNAKLIEQQRVKSMLPRQKPKKVSDKRKAENPIYSERRKIFLEGKMCAVYPDLPATEVHHMAGRRGYVDKYAYDNGITAFLDERYWLAVSEPGHIKITADSVWSIDKGFSILRSVPIRQTI